MKGILSLTAAALLATYVNANATDQHQKHHTTQAEKRACTSKQLKAEKLAHNCDHNGNVAEAKKHVQKAGSLKTAHNEDHNNKTADTDSHTNDHKPS